MVSETKSVRKPVQERAKATREKILAAAEEIFGAQGLEATTTHAIAEKAEVSVGSLYAYFKDKESILVELFDRHAEDLLEILQEPFKNIEWATFDAENAVRVAVEASAACHKHNPGLHRVFTSLEFHPIIAERWRGWMRKGLERLRSILEMAGDHVKVKNKEVAAFVIYNAVEGACHRATFYDEGPGFDKTVDGLTDLITAYLLRE